MNVEIKNLKRSIYIAIAGTMLALAILFWFFSQSFVTFKITPSNAKLTVDNQPVAVSASGIAKKNLVPGQHLVKVEADNYIGYSETLDFSHGFLPQIKITLLQSSKPVEISGGSEFLSKGNDFNDGYYLGNGGTTIYKMKIGLDTNSNVGVISNYPITSARLSGIQEIIWSPDKSLALFRKASGITLFDFQKYDFVHQTETAWGTNIGSIAWSPDNSKIAYNYSPPSGERTLVYADLANTAPSVVANFKDLGIVNPILHWSPDSQWLLVIPRNADYSQNKIYAFSTYSRTFKQLTETGSQLDALFSPDGNKILFSTYSKVPDNTITSVLSVMDIDGSNVRSLGIRAELNKVTWEKDSQNIIVAAPDVSNQQETLSKYDTSKGSDSGFVLSRLGRIYIQSLELSDDGKIILYQTSDGIFALKTN